MSIATGVARMFSTTPVTPMGADGKMALADHLRELRGRVLRSLVVLIVAVVAAFFVYEDLVKVVNAPIAAAEKALEGKVDIETTFIGVGASLMFQIKLCFLAAVIATSPFWLYQLWAFIVPGLHAHERRYSRVFLAIAGPLFLGGVATGYYVLPTGLKVLLSFAGDIPNLVPYDMYFSFFIRMLLVFGVAYLIPMFVILLNLAGIVRGKALGQYRPWIVIGTFVFAAAATPSTDPFSMLLLAVPMTLLFFISEVVARILDKRRGIGRYEGLDDDEASDLDYDRDVIRYTGLSEEDDD
jgi:sec-independent protein translocase protein TatC